MQYVSQGPPGDMCAARRFTGERSKDGRFKVSGHLSGEPGDSNAVCLRAIGDVILWCTGPEPGSEFLRKRARSRDHAVARGQPDIRSFCDNFVH